ncbi:hypothetical protein SETIT_6G075600v2 [Setaria italica]|uniref:Uncharacterized protein n=1 Tax=Setaria italica TaxID=4555 RepID=A0A368RJ36_SETIT|nr:hypothetical protein SETIT_6G075600v2 [Setaria italica]
MAMPWFEAARELQRSSFYRQNYFPWLITPTQRGLFLIVCCALKYCALY